MQLNKNDNFHKNEVQDIRWSDNNYKYRLAGNITEFSKGVDYTQHWPRNAITEWYMVAECVLRSGRTHVFGSLLLIVA